MSVPRVALIKPPERSDLHFGVYNLAALAAAIRDESEVSIVDATFLSLDAAVAAALNPHPTLIGVTVMGFESVPQAGCFIRSLRARLEGKSVQVVCGGHGASCSPRPLLEAGADAVAVGEGETTLCEIVAHGIRPGAPGLVSLREGSLLAGPPQELIDPLDSLPLPARDLMPDPPGGIHQMETSRGCLHACGFCETSHFHQQRWRGFSAERTAAEVDRLCGDFGAMIIRFTDDSFAADPHRALRICDALSRGRLPALIMASARADDLTAIPDLLPAMARARILCVCVGIETLDPEAARRVGKPLSLDLYQELFHRMREVGIFSSASFIVGLPGESTKQRARSVDLALAAGPDSARFLPFVPFPGTPLAAGFTAGRTRLDDERDALAFTEAFDQDPAVQSRLESMVERGGVLGMLAQGVLGSYVKMQERRLNDQVRQASPHQC